MSYQQYSLLLSNHWGTYRCMSLDCLYMYHHSYMGCISSHQHLEITYNTLNTRQRFIHWGTYRCMSLDCLYMYHHSYMGCINSHPHLEITLNTFNTKAKVQPLGHLQVYTFNTKAKLQPLGHLQVYEPGLSIHVPPFIHGLYKQSSTSGNNIQYI